MGAARLGCGGGLRAGCEVGGEVVDVGVGDMERPNPDRLAGPVGAHVADTGCAGENLVTDCAGLAGGFPTRMENNCRMGRTSLDGSCTAAITDTPTARPWESGSPKSCSTSVRVLRSPI